MANIKSAIKRVSIAERNRQRNKAYKSAVKTLTKRFLVSVEAYASNPEPESLKTVQDSMSTVYSKIDKAVKKGVLHRNCGARKKAQIAALLKQHLASAS